MSATSPSLSSDTIVLHGGNFRHDPATSATTVPIYQTTSFDFPDTATAIKIVNFEQLAYTYSRVVNPTVNAFEERLAALEGGAAALGLASGQAAVAIAVLTLVEAGDNIVSSPDLYGGTVHFFRERLKQFGIEARFVDPADPENFRRATDARTRLYFGESLPNPKLSVFPIAEVAALGRPLGIPLIIDNTAAPLAIAPFDHGAAITVYSATKYIGGHGTTIGGAIVDSGTFPWADFPERQPLLLRPDPGYGNRTYLELSASFGPVAYLTRARAALLRDLGPSLAPQNAFLLLQGLETLPLRLQRHFDNAAKVADYLAHHPKVARVVYPGLQTGLDRARADAYLKYGYGGLVGFEPVGGEAAAFAFIDRLKLFYHLANIGDARSLAIHPASTTHAQLDAQQLAAAGITPAFVRLSIGLEDPNDIIADIAQALEGGDASKGAG
ncbi:O-acetylhomoserine aminocarboxypropyltransferase [Rhodoblastus sphagnicola]|uniref:O-acetylhomoserine aminocarboxypropyltransferase n=1 Tax=Rhodoblastus sphagnicola TaxID=333368 RepID=A0A2S6MVW5_9HYPH|nr:PLP-dependent transferase [Rhodoblastus sphagnicola]MBB4197546.1 O-acetylhomoserine (thiol)-lyase [Rhodoblastus sphagnicola]PPQ26489.1 O-acetylhomoserine aminocarboxypropyltransferase [Rhodoblastus sphagnicola]